VIKLSESVQQQQEKPVCPKCKHELDYLIVYAQGTTEFRFSVGESGHTAWEARGTTYDEEEDRFLCPYCEAIILEGDLGDVALDFLKGEAKFSPIEDGCPECSCKLINQISSEDRCTLEYYQCAKCGIWYNEDGKEDTEDQR